MRHLKTFESFSINELQDWAMLPVDVHKGMGDLYDDAWEGIKKFSSKGASFLKDLVKSSGEFFMNLINKLKVGVENIIEKIEKYFGCPLRELTLKDVFNKIISKSRQEEISEQVDIEDPKSVAQKFLTFLQKIFGVNMFGGIISVAVVWVTETFTNFDIVKWAYSNPWLQEHPLIQPLFNPGSRGFMPMWFVASLVAIFIIALVKYIVAYFETSGKPKSKTEPKHKGSGLPYSMTYQEAEKKVKETISKYEEAERKMNTGQPSAIQDCHNEVHRLLDYLDNESLRRTGKEAELFSKLHDKLEDFAFSKHYTFDFED